jgi:hypothetical protein
MFDNLRDRSLATVWGWHHHFLGTLSVRFSAGGRAAGFFRRLGMGARRVRSGWWPILQTAVAASAAWYLAALLLGTSSRSSLP